MAITRVQTATGASGLDPQTTSAFGSSVTANNLIVAVASGYNGVSTDPNPFTFSDSKGNTYSTITFPYVGVNAGDRLSTAIGVAIAATGGTAFTVTVNLNGSSNCSVVAFEYSGLPSTVVRADCNYQLATGTDPEAAIFAPTNCLIIGALTNLGTPLLGVDIGTQIAELDEVNTFASLNVLEIIGSGRQTPNWSLSASNLYYCSAVAIYETNPNNTAPSGKMTRHRR